MSIKIPQYERQVELGANQTREVRLAAPMEMPDLGKPLQEAASAISGISNIAYEYGKRKEKEDFALIEAEVDNRVANFLNEQGTKNVGELDNEDTWEKERASEYKNFWLKTGEELKKKYPAYSNWQQSDRGQITMLTTDNAFGTVKSKLWHDHKVSDLSKVVNNALTQHYLANTDLSGEALDKPINELIAPYERDKNGIGYLSDSEIARIKQDAFNRAYGVFIDKAVKTGSTADITELLRKLQASKPDGTAKYFQKMEVEDRAKYIEFIERNKAARAGTLSESNAEEFISKFNYFVENNTPAEIRNKAGKKIETGIKEANRLLSEAKESPFTFSRKHNLSQRQIPQITNYMESVLNNSAQGAKAVLEFNNFEIEYNTAMSDKDLTMANLGVLYSVLKEKTENGEWGIDRAGFNKAAKMLVEIENVAANKVKDNDVEPLYTNGWFGPKTNDQFVLAALPEIVAEVYQVGNKEAIPASLLGKAYLYAYSVMEQNGITGKNSTNEEKIMLKKVLQDYINNYFKWQYPLYDGEADKVAVVGYKTKGQK